MMKIHSGSSIKAWDAYTIAHEPITSLDLMERASSLWVERFLQHSPEYSTPIDILCGPGNNGGDGLAIARILRLKGYDISVYLCTFGVPASSDFNSQLARLEEISGVNFITPSANAHVSLHPNAWCIDALFGIGLNRSLDGLFAQLVIDINSQNPLVFAVDMPSGLLSDQLSTGPVLQADYTLTFSRPKLAFFAPDNQDFLGHWEVIPIGLGLGFDLQHQTAHHFLTAVDAKRLYKPRKTHEHKGIRGHACLMAGSHGKMGAAILSTHACVRSGAGLTTIHTPTCGTDILQIAVPEAMVSTDTGTHTIHHLPAQLDRFDAIGFGPGVGQAANTAQVLMDLFNAEITIPFVLDADTLNLLAGNQILLSKLPKNTILTPHHREFERLFGESNNFFEKLELARAKAQEHQIILVLKGANCPIVLPDGQVWFNSTGNPGMATGGSGDVLTGLITGLLAQGYAPAQAACLGAYLHGLAGDFAAGTVGMDSLIASDIIQHLGAAFQSLKAR